MNFWYMQKTKKKNNSENITNWPKKCGDYNKNINDACQNR